MSDNVSAPSDCPALLGGQPICRAEWPTWPIHDGEEESRLLKVLRSGEWWFGENVKQFEQDFAAFQGAKYGVTCTNGTTAIEMGLRALGVVEGDEVIVPPYSFISTASAVVTIGAIPVFADIEAESLCIDPEDVERKITRRTKAIIPVHIAGLMADMERINALAKENGLFVLEDAAHAWGSQLQGLGAGTWGACGTFSFQISKNITAGEGGILVTNDEELADLCRSFTHCGRTKDSQWYDHDQLGSNLRLTEFQAAILLAQLGRLADQVHRREVNATRLDKALADIPGLSRLAQAPQMTRRSYHMAIFRLEESVFGLPRDQFLKALNAEGIPATEGWYRPLYKNGVFQNAHRGRAHGIRAPLADKGVDYREVSCPVCEQVCCDAVWIPQNVLLAEESQFEKVIQAIHTIATHAGSLRDACPDSTEGTTDEHG